MRITRPVYQAYNPLGLKRKIKINNINRNTLKTFFFNILYSGFVCEWLKLLLVQHALYICYLFMPCMEKNFYLILSDLSVVLHFTCILIVLT